MNTNIEDTGQMNTNIEDTGQMNTNKMLNKQMIGGYYFQLSISLVPMRWLLMNTKIETSTKNILKQ